MKNKPWFTFKNEAGQTPELLIYDVIGDWAGLSARELVAELKAIDSPTITVRINSPGGSVFDGIAIYNALRHHPAEIEVRIEGLAASIASVIAMAGDRIQMAANALMMIHNPFGWVGGDAEALRKMADMMDKTTEVIAQTYAAHSSLDLNDIIRLMSEETWFTAQEALDSGLITHIDEPVKMVATFDLSAFGRVPTDAFPHVEPVDPVSENPDPLAIMALCNQLGYPEMAEAFVRQSTSIEAVRTELFDLIAHAVPVIDTALTPEQQSAVVKNPINTHTIYERRNSHAS